MDLVIIQEIASSAKTTIVFNASKITLSAISVKTDMEKTEQEDAMIALNQTALYVKTITLCVPSAIKTIFCIRTELVTIAM